VVDVSVAEDQRIDTTGLEGEGRRIASILLSPALDQAAVEQRSTALGAQYVAAAGDFACGAAEDQIRSHG
jgi:hypothetical protein